MGFDEFWNLENVGGALFLLDLPMYVTLVTQTGWMMWNWLVGMLTVGGACVLYDGSPLVPNPNILWDLIDRLHITVLGTGAKWLAVLEQRGIKPSTSSSLLEAPQAQAVSIKGYLMI